MPNRKQGGEILNPGRVDIFLHDDAGVVWRIRIVAGESAEKRIQKLLYEEGFADLIPAQIGF